MNGPRIAIIDYQAGNLRSVQKALQRFGADAFITGDPDDLRKVDAVVFPGQGSNDSSMQHLKARGLVDPIKQFIASGNPFLGVCLGLELLMEGSDEGVEPGLGVLKGWCRRLPSDVKVPHMGWNQVGFKIAHPVFSGVPSSSYFYFVHSYYADPVEESVVSATTEYGLEFCSAVAWKKIVAVQFHPEKSGNVGLTLYKNFVQLADEGR